MLTQSHSTDEAEATAPNHPAGCPFAEKEVRLLSEAVKQTPDLKVVVVQHSDEQETQAWWQRIK